MEYPKDFPERLKHAVEAAISQAEINFTKQARNFRGYWHPEEGEQWMYEYVHEVFAAFADKACCAFEEGIWSGEVTRNALDIFRESIINHVFVGKHPNPTDDSLRSKFRHHASRSLWISEKWFAIQAELKRISEAQELQNAPRQTSSETLLEKTKRVTANADVRQVIRAEIEAHNTKLHSRETKPRRRKKGALNTRNTRAMRRRALWRSYSKAFNEKIVILDVCWAAKQHYREWTRWLSGELKDELKADYAFKAILTSKKRPQEHRPEPRPKTFK